MGDLSPGESCGSVPRYPGVFGNTPGTSVMDANDDRDPPLGNPPSPAEHAQKPPPRRNRPSLATRIKELRKAGATAITVLPDGSVLGTFSEPTKPQKGNALDEWKANRANKSKGH
jgi:hypothetical protein